MVPLDPLSPGALIDAEIDVTMGYAEQTQAVSTRLCYERDFRAFAVWCYAKGATP